MPIRSGEKEMQKRRKIISDLAKFLVFQILIVTVFLYFFQITKPVKHAELVSGTITVDNIEYYRAFSEYNLNIYSGSNKYSFPNLGTLAEYSNSELHKQLSQGDIIEVIYYEKAHGLRGKSRWIVEAKSETQTYRSLSEYYNSKHGLPIFVIAAFSILEIIFLCILIFYILLHKNEIKKSLTCRNS